MKTFNLGQTISSLTALEVKRVIRLLVKTHELDAGWAVFDYNDIDYLLSVLDDLCNNYGIAIVEPTDDAYWAEYHDNAVDFDA